MTIRRAGAPVATATADAPRALACANAENGLGGAFFTTAALACMTRR